MIFRSGPLKNGRKKFSFPDSDQSEVTLPESMPLFAPCTVRVLLFTFALALLLGLFIQIILLPVLLPQIHAGHGLLLGGDAIGYHQDAVNLAKTIAEKGWGEFELRPNLSALVSISALIYYATGFQEPWILLPLNAAIFALGAAGLFNIFRLFATPWIATFALFSYLFFPSSVQLYSQIYKDVWSVTGFIWLVFVWVVLASGRRVYARYGVVLVMIAFLASGAIWLVRPYLATIFLAVFGAGASFVVGWDILAARWGVRRRFSNWLFLAASIAAVAFFALDVPARITSSAHLKPSSNLLGMVRSDPLRAECRRDPGFIDRMLPSIVVRGLNPVIATRMGQVAAPQVAGSAIDQNVCVRYPGDVIVYAPRAMQIALFAPFPNMWFTSGQSPGAFIMRSIAGLEMLASYALYPGIVLLFVLQRGCRRQTVLIVLVSSLLLCLFAVVISNVGTLYRMRYGYVQMLLGLGVVGWGLLWLRMAAWREVTRRAPGSRKRNDVASS